LPPTLVVITGIASDCASRFTFPKLPFRLTKDKKYSSLSNISQRPIGNLQKDNIIRFNFFAYSSCSFFPGSVAD
jgi:hypothetical protein